MSLASRLRVGFYPLTETGLSGASGTTFACNAVPQKDVVPGSLTSRVAISISTSSVTLSPQWQVSNDNSTWTNVKTDNNAALVGTAASATYWLNGPPCLQSYQFARFTVLSSGSSAATATNEFLANKYNYEKNEDFRADIRGTVQLTTVATSNVTSTFGGPTLVMDKPKVGTVAANLSVCIKTNNLVYTPKWQVSDDGSTWEDLKPSNGATNVAFATGTGTSATTVCAIQGPLSLAAHRYGRIAMAVSGTSNTSLDDVVVSYNYVQRLDI